MIKKNMKCFRCHEDVESRKINGIETEFIQYKCGEEQYTIHTGCIYNHHTENRRNIGKKCVKCQGNNPNCSIEDVKATLETVLQLTKIQLWEDLGF
jgi:hypothetical protein